MENQKSKYWLDILADEIAAKTATEEIIISSGHSPSGTYHIGLLREMMIANALTWALQERGKTAVHVDFVDDFDILRKIPKDLPESLESELGKPLYLAASPEAGVSYADFFYRDLTKSSERIGFKPDRTYFARDTYGKEHKFTEAIEKVLSNLPQAKKIIEKVSHRQLPSDWAPVQILSDDNRLNTWKYVGHDISRQLVEYQDQNGGRGEASYSDGRVKLDWRLDWPARWWIWGVNVEPFGRDHASKGGSYDTGKEIVKAIFGGQPPIPVPYGFINPIGQTKKFSKSEGGVLTPNDVADIMPAEVIRYYAVRSRPEKEIIFDPGLAMSNLIDEFAAAQSDPNHEFRDAYNFAISGKNDHIISSVPFKHLVQVYQTAHRKKSAAIQILSRQKQQGDIAWDGDEKIIDAELDLIETWLKKYAPDSVKFSVQEEIPKTKLTDEQKQALSEISDRLKLEKGEIDGQKMHQLIYAVKEERGLKPNELFGAIYQVILGQDNGPKAGWFLANLDKDWLVKRLKLES